MDTIISTYSQKEHGLLLLNPPTGMGKTHYTLKWIEENYQDFCVNGKKIFFITNLKKNLPYEDLFKKVAQKYGQNTAEKDLLFIDSNRDFFKTNLPKINFPESIKNDNLFKSIIEESLNVIKSVNNNFSDANYTNFLDNRLNELEQNFRKKIEEFLSKKISSSKEKKDKQQKKELIKTNPNYSWIATLYPTVFTDDYKVYFLSINKFFVQNTTLIEPSYSFLNASFIQNSLIFIDEFDASKKPILNGIIENSISQGVNFISIISHLNQVFLHKKFPQYIEKQTPIQKFSEEIKTLNSIYNIKSNFKLIENNEDKKQSFLFHDFKFHQISKGGKKFLTTKFNNFSNLNELYFEEKKPNKHKENVLYLLNDCRQLIIRFAWLINKSANILCDEKSDSNYDLDNALSTVLYDFGFQKKSAEYEFFIELINKGANTKTKNENDLFDKSFYTNGFDYFELEDNPDHDNITQIYNYNYSDTPEKYLVDLASKSFVIGLSATAKIPTILGNYDLSYLKRKLGTHFFTLTKEEITYLEQIVKSKTKNYDKVNIITQWFGGNEKDNNSLKKDISKQLFDDSRTEEERQDYTLIFLTKFKEESENSYVIARYFKLFCVFKEFIIRDDFYSILCLFNKGIGNDFSKEFILTGFEFLIQYYRKESFFLDDKGNFSVNNALFIIEGKNYHKAKKELSFRLSEGKKTLILSTYQTLGAGQNLQYIAPKNKQLIDVQDEKEYNWNVLNEKDIQGIYLHKPTHLLQNIIDIYQENLSYSEKIQKKIHWIYEAEYLFETGEITISELENMIEQAFNKQDYKKKLSKGIHAKLYVFVKIVQGIGRICRTNLKDPFIYIFADKELEKIIYDIDVSNEFLLPEVKAFIQSCNYLHEKTSDFYELQNLANRTNLRWKKTLEHYVNTENWKWSEQKIKDWKAYRNQVIKFPFLEEGTQLEKQDFYIQLPTSASYYQYEYEGESCHFFEDKLSFFVSQEDARLPELLEIPDVKNYFIEQGFCTEWKESQYIMPPFIYQAIYKAVLGEEVGLFLLQHKLMIELEELRTTSYELFDYKVKGKNIFIDFKHWRESTYLNHSDKADYKLNLIKQNYQIEDAKVLIINILSDNYTQPYISDSIIEIPSLFDTKNKKFNDLAFKQIQKCYANSN